MFSGVRGFRKQVENRCFSDIVVETAFGTLWGSVLGVNKGSKTGEKRGPRRYPKLYQNLIRFSSLQGEREERGPWGAGSLINSSEGRKERSNGQLSHHSCLRGTVADIYIPIALRANPATVPASGHTKAELAGLTGLGWLSWLA